MVHSLSLDFPSQLLVVVDNGMINFALWRWSIDGDPLARARAAH